MKKMHYYKRNTTILPIYTPVWVYKDGYELCILSEPLLVDDQRGHIVFNENGMDTKYLYWDIPLLLDGPEGPSMIASLHSVEIEKKSRDAIRSLIIPSPHDIIIMGKKPFQLDIGLYQVNRIGKRDPILIVPDTLVDHDSGDSIDIYVRDCIFDHQNEVEGAYAILIGSHDPEFNTSIIHKTSLGYVTLYIDQIAISHLVNMYHRSHTSNLYFLTTKVTDHPVYLYIDQIEYTLSDTKEGLLRQLDRYIGTGYKTIPPFFNDICIYII